MHTSLCTPGFPNSINPSLKNELSFCCCSVRLIKPTYHDNIICELKELNTKKRRFSMIIGCHNVCVLFRKQGKFDHPKRLFRISRFPTPGAVHLGTNRLQISGTFVKASTRHRLCGCSHKKSRRIQLKETRDDLRTAITSF